MREKHRLGRNKANSQRRNRSALRGEGAAATAAVSHGPRPRGGRPRGPQEGPSSGGVSGTIRAGFFLVFALWPPPAPRLRVLFTPRWERKRRRRTVQGCWSRHRGERGGPPPRAPLPLRQLVVQPTGLNLGGIVLFLPS